MKHPRFQVLPNTDRRRPSQKWMVEYRTPEGLRKRPTFKTKGEAEAFRRDREAEASNIGFQAMGLSNEQRIEAAKVFRLLEKHNLKLSDVAMTAVKNAEVNHRSCTVGEVYMEFLRYKKQGGKSAHYLHDLKSKVGRFAKEFGSRKVSSFTTRELDSWLGRLDVSPLTRNNYRRNLGVLFQYAQDQGFCDQNPIKKAQVVKVIEGKPGVLTPEGMSALLKLVRGLAPDYLPALVIQAFSGLRTEEVLRLDWSDIHWDEQLVEVPATKAKTAQTRHIKIRSNLREWLEPFHRTQGRMVPTRYRRWLARFRKDLKTIGHEFPGNGLRHSFASYDYAHGNDSAKTAKDLGHATPTMLFQHYHALVKPAQAALWWEIRPEPTVSENASADPAILALDAVQGEMAAVAV